MEQTPNQSHASLSDYLAAERTFLAWVRTGIALMGFGFVIARFGLFLEAMQAGQPEFQLRQARLSPWIGTALLLMGTLVIVWSAWNHLRLVRDLKRGEAAFPQRSTLVITVAGVLAALGLALAIYLISTRNTPQSKQPNPQEKAMNSNSKNGIVSIKAHQSVDQTVQKLQEILAAKGIKLFALVDHSGEAEKAGLAMRPTKLLIFGSPKAGTPLMLAAPTIALDLPLKILVAESEDGTTLVSYNDAAYLQERHNLPANLAPVIAAVGALAGKAAE